MQNGTIGEIYGMTVSISNVVPAGTPDIISTGQNQSAAEAEAADEGPRYPGGLLY